MKNKLLIAAASLIGAFLITIVVSFFGVFYGVDKYLNGFFYVFFGEKLSENSVVIVSANQEDLDYFSNSQRLSEREVYVNAVDFLDEQGAKVIGIDVLFDDVSKGLSGFSLENLLVDFDGFSKNELFDVLNRFISDDSHPIDEQFIKLIGDLSGILVFSREPRSTDFLMPYSALGNALKTNLSDGFLPLDPDLVIRRQKPVVKLDSGVSFESMGMKVARKYLEGELSGKTGEIRDGYYWPQIDARPDLRISLDSDGNMMINFFGKAFSYPTISMTDVLSGNFAPGFFQDKIVLVGATSPQMNDNYLTPIDGVPMPGVEIHANVVSTILQEKFLIDQSFGSQVLVNLILSAIATLAFLYLPMLYAVSVFFILPFLYFLLGAYAFRNGVVFSVAYPFLNILLCFCAAFFYRYSSEIKDKSFIKEAFSHYLSPEIVEELSQNPELLHLGGVKREITVLFMDIENFTTISEKLDPESLVSLLNSYFDRMSKVLLSFGATLDKFQGDAVMAFFNAPVPQEDHRQRAVLACVKIFEELKIFNEFLKQKGFEVAIRTRIGLSTGEAVVGNMGSKARFDFTAIGDTINLASRLENLNKQYGTRVMMSEICAQGVLALDGLDARIRELDFVVVKGKTKAVRVYELLVDETLLGNSAKAMKYVDALNLYRKRDFAGAVEVLKQMGIGSESSNFDLPAARLYGLCEALLKNPPSESWQPVNFMGEFKI